LAKSPITYLSGDRDQVVNYISPTYAGFQLQVGHAGKNTVTATTVTEATTDSTDAYAIQYSAGKFSAVAGKATQKASAETDNLVETNYGVKYDFGVAEVAVAYHTQDKDGGTAKKTGKTASVAVPVAALGSGVKLHAVYVGLDDVADATKNYDAYKFAVTKAFSKRTTGYVAYTSQEIGSTTTTTPTSLIVGMVHSF
jgi:predicted porin